MVIILAVVRGTISGAYHDSELYQLMAPGISM